MAIEIPGPVADRLATEQNIWLTTTRADGMPLPNTVWFLWRNGEFFVSTAPEAFKVKNMKRNLLVSLNLNTSSLDGSDVAIFQAQADFSKPSTEDDFQAYLKKYKEGIAALGFTEEYLRSDFVLIRLKLLKYRTVVWE